MASSRMGAADRLAPVGGGGLIIETGDPTAADVAELLEASERHARALYPPASVHMLPIAELAAPSVGFVVARHGDGPAIGCGAIVVDRDGFAEIKRMFVAGSARRRGVASAILGRLEAAARDRGVRAIRLETGVRQRQAIRLYRKFGYRDRGPFDHYRPDPLSIFMEKQLS